MSNPRAKLYNIVPNSNLIKIEHNSNFYYGTSRQKAWVAKWSTARALRARQYLFVGSNPTSCNIMKIPGYSTPATNCDLFNCA